MRAGRWTQSRNRQSKESTDEGQEKQVALDSLSDLRRKDADQGISRHSAGQFPALLQEMQKGNPHQCGPAKNGREQRSKRLTKRQLPESGKLPLFMYYFAYRPHFSSECLKDCPNDGSQGNRFLLGTGIHQRMEL